MKRTKFIIKCSICGKDFFTIPSKTKNKFCSKNCYYIARKRGHYSPYWEGKNRSEETKNKISMKNKGKKIWCEGKKLSKEHIKKLSQAKIGKYVGFLHPNWKGGIKTDERGYIRIWTGNKQWRYEHNLVMEKILGRPLKTGEVVHHINCDKSDNRIDNLMLFPSRKAHTEYHIRVLKMPIKNQYS